MARVKRAQSQDEFARSLWATVKEMETMYDVDIGLHMQRTSRAGVWRVLVRATRYCNDSHRHRQAARIEGEWPNAESQQLVAYQFGLALKLDHMLGEDLLSSEIARGT